MMNIKLLESLITYIPCMPGRGTCLRRPLGTRRPPRLFEKLESYCIQLASLITRYSVLIYCAKEKNAKKAAERICKRKGKNTIFVKTFGQVQAVTVLSVYGIAWILGCLVEASCLLRIIMFLGIAYGLGNLFNDIRCETSACAQEGPPDVPKTDRGVRLMHS